jgi:hypothetical protein
MKKSDLAMIILIAGMSALIAFLIGNQIAFLKPDQNGVKIPTAQKISTSVTEPDPAIFNKDAINPTVQTVIGGNGQQAQ